MPKQIYWEDVEVGDQLPTIVRGPLRVSLRTAALPADSCFAALSGGRASAS